MTVAELLFVWEKAAHSVYRACLLRLFGNYCECASVSTVHFGFDSGL